MGTLFRSQEMTLCQLFIQSEATYTCVSELGELGLVQFRDMNESTSGFQRKFVTEIRRCDEMDRKLRFLEKEISKEKSIKIHDNNENPEAPQPRQMIEMEATFEKLETELRQVNVNSEALRRSFLELTELKHLLQKTQQFFDEPLDITATANQRSSAPVSRNYGGASRRSERVNLLSASDDEPAVPQPQSGLSPIRFGFVAGVIPCERMRGFELMLWRACRGNVFLRRSEIEELLDDPSTDDPVHKFAFVVFYQGEQLKSRINKICEAFRASVYPCPDTPAERREMLDGVMARLHDLNTVLKQTDDHRRRVLQAAAQNLRVWLIRVGKIKAIYMTLNLFNIDVTQKFMIGEAWCPVDGLETIRSALKRGAERSGAGVQAILNRVATAEQPPTYNKVNRFTESFQNLVDAYGSGAYREVNPTPFVIITFPFLFGVMFGDLGHGILMFCFALFLVLKERWLATTTGVNEIWATIFGGRYIILLMSIFSMYTGFLYNDIFAKSMNFFGTGWFYPNGSWMPQTGSVQLNPNDTNQWSGAAYPFGVDPVWQLAGNKISFTNSLKMKMSIILGVVHMSVGVVLSVYNHTFFRRRMSIFFEWIPQVLFLEFIFGYLMILIIYKWCIFTPDTSGSAPSLLIGLINMFMLKYPEGDVMVYNGQQGVQTFLVLVAILCIPVMLAVKPIITICSQKSAGHHHHHDDEQHGIENPLAAENQGEGTSSQTSDVEAGTSSSAPAQTSDDHHGDSTSDIVVHQAIHTIEFCLGCISNTASYLRLWALSLAHAQLSEVLWDMVMHIGLSVSGPIGGIMLYVVFIPFSVLTVGILLVMEGLSAFLHALRLHWVEFMNKFYAGTGYPFEPFSFAAVLNVRISQE